ncbi:integumentary mucin C.1-like [Mytilus californianus]|uniref:integumentary mucin C.1-like n=1 Tax=Mytilus californianus TaxID=6549 RepID=UPI002247439B|nr:integumentary mucin C.1-like [Mytilus californianus]
MPKLNWLFVEGNPLDCGCPVENFRTWLLSLDQSITFDAFCENGDKVVDLPGASFDVCVVTTTSTTTTTTTTTTTLPPTTTTTTSTTTTTPIPTTEESTVIISVVPEEGDALVTFLISLILLIIIVMTCVGVLILNYKYRNLLKIQPEKEGEFDKPDETEAEENVNLTDSRY